MEKEIKDKILKEYEKGNIVICSPDGIVGTSLSEILKQPIEGLLYDLNRDEMTILTFVEDKKWINDYALTKVVRALKSKVDDLEATNKEIREENESYKEALQYVINCNTKDRFKCELDEAIRKAKQLLTSKCCKCKKNEI